MEDKAHRYVWRKSVNSRGEGEWTERLHSLRGRLAITSFAGRPRLRLEVFRLTRVEAARLVGRFGGAVSREKKLASDSGSRPPLRIRNKLVVLGHSRDRAKAAGSSPRRQILGIPAGMAFGSGDHATTASCLRLLADVSDGVRGRRWELLDLGTGSGILAIAGRMLGAHRADACDVDADAVRVAKENVRINAVDRVFIRRIDVCQWEPVRTWDVVTANLFSGILTALAPKLFAATAPGGQLIFSGVLREQETEVLAAFAAEGFRFGRLIRNGKWIAGSVHRPA